ncbi:MAG: hypothetical protein E6J90_44535 [Deltaproteobacteria bacterium]|nr:MAG: hypothetical protein E6J90_44535 [Deltaproteobacteria bacterium]
MRNSLLWSSFALGLLACSHHKPQVATAGPPVTDTASTSKCGVMQTPGTNVVTADTNDGVAIVFTTTGDVSDLRAQVRQIADHHNEMVGTQPGQVASPGGPSDTHGATVGGDVHGGVGSHEATAGADVHGGVKDDSSNKTGATAGADVHAGVKDKGATVGADVHGGVGGHTATAGTDVHAGVKDKDKTSGATAGADVHGGVDDRSATAGADVHGGVNDRTATAGADVHGGVNGPNNPPSRDMNNPNNPPGTGVNSPINDPSNTGNLQSGMDLAMVPARARVEDVPGGARRVLIPQDPSQLPALREQAREQVSMLEKGECPRLMTEPQLQPTGDNPNRHPTGT